jgi:hypothetical protein
LVKAKRCGRVKLVNGCGCKWTWETPQSL